MVKATQSWLRDHSTRSSRLHSPLVGRVPLKREVAAVIVVVAKVLGNHSPEMLLVEDNHVVEALAAYGSNQSFNVGILPWRFRRDEHFLDVHPLHPTLEPGLFMNNTFAGLDD